MCLMLISVENDHHIAFFFNEKNFSMKPETVSHLYHSIKKFIKITMSPLFIYTVLWITTIQYAKKLCQIKKKLKNFKKLCQK